MITRKALLVGINDYAPAGAGGPDLRGCVNDVRDMALTLNGLGIVRALPSSMHILTNAKATKANILSGIKWLITGAKRDDILVFYYSGHGSYVVDTSHDDPDGKDEAICPHDFRTAGMIIDDTLRAAFAGLAAGVNLEVIFDSCFSGSATRIAVGGGAEITPRYIEPTDEYAIFSEAQPDLPWRRLLKPANGGERVPVIVPGLNHVYWAASADNQTSGEGPISGSVRGYFTYCFCRALRNSHASVTRRALDSLVTHEVGALTNKSQTPQLEATAKELIQQVFK